MYELNIWNVMSFMTILFMSSGDVTHSGKLGVLPASYVVLFCFSFTPSLQLCLLPTNGLLLSVLIHGCTVSQDLQGIIIVLDILYGTLIISFFHGVIKY